MKRELEWFSVDAVGSSKQLGLPHWISSVGNAGTRLVLPTVFQAVSWGGVGFPTLWPVIPSYGP